MNSRSLLTLLVAAGLAAPSLGFAQQREMQMMEDPVLAANCSGVDITPTNARRVLAWAEANQVIPKDALLDMIYVATKDGLKERKRLFFPLFGTWDSNDIENTVVWEPGQHGWPELVPDDIEWVFRCRSK